MKRHWLRGLLLGVSMVLLLGGGVALAALSMSIEPYCNVCCDACQDPWLCSGWGVSSTGWACAQELDVTLESPGPWGSEFFEDAFPLDIDGEVFFNIYIMCPECSAFVEPQGLADTLVAWGDWQPGDYGEWTLQLDECLSTVRGYFYFAEDPSECQVEAFVPEPGSIILLGSGLAGLGGYATLRLRSRGDLR
jgi:hypothetical protein